MPIVKRVRFDREKEFEHLKMGRLTGEDSAEAQIARTLFHFSSGGARINFYRAGVKPWGGLSRGMQTAHFSALCRYISKPEELGETARVSWIESRNLPGLAGKPLSEDDAGQAAFWMGSTAALNRDTPKRAAIHYIVSFSPKDKHRLHDVLIKDVADKCLETLGAQEHQALIACHIDRDHTHLHIVLNRIHPVTEKPVNSFRDMVKLERLMRKIENQYHLEPVQGRHFDLNGNPLPPNAPRPHRRQKRSRALGDMHSKLNKENPFQNARNWNELLQMGRDKGVDIIHTGARMELRMKGSAHSIPASDLFKKDAQLDTLEKKFGESYATWQRNQNEARRAVELGLTLSALHALDEERRLKEKATARKRMLKQRREHEKSLRRITERPIRIANNPDLYPECSEIYGPAIHNIQAREVLKILRPDEVRNWLKRTETAIETLEKFIDEKSKDREAWVQDENDALSQMECGISTVQKEAEGMGLIPKTKITSKSKRQSQEPSNQTKSLINTEPHR